jgi:hypothetical protein
LCRELGLTPKEGLAKRSRGKPVELLGELRPLIAGMVRLLFAHHADHSDPTQDQGAHWQWT